MVEQQAARLSNYKKEAQDLEDRALEGDEKQFTADDCLAKLEALHGVRFHHNQRHLLVFLRLNACCLSPSKIQGSFAPAYDHDNLLVCRMKQIDYGL